MNYKLTYKDALKMCEAYKNFNFFKTEHMFGGYRVTTFNYFLCDYNMFMKPLVDEPEINALDMRGVTFVFNEDGTLYKRFLMLKKFFNLNQVVDTQYDVLKDKKIDFVTNKEDGSLIGFMELPNGDIFAKTQRGFTNEQSEAAMLLYDTQPGVRNFVDHALHAGFTPLFEYVSYDNRIVLKYINKELRLIGMRDNDNGQFFSAVYMYKLKESFNLDVAIKEIKFESLDEIIELMKTATNIEGVVVHFIDNQMIKIKSKWYCDLHDIRTVNIFRENFVIRHLLEETLDDVTQELNMTDDADAFKFIDNVKVAVINWINYIDKCVNFLIKEYEKIGDWKEYATINHKKAFFGLAKTKIQQPELYIKRKILYMLNASKHLMEAKKIIEKYKNEI